MKKIFLNDGLSEAWEDNKDDWKHISPDVNIGKETDEGTLYYIDIDDGQYDYDKKVERDRDLKALKKKLKELAKK